jgi:hypothetical protein
MMRQGDLGALMNATLWRSLTRREKLRLPANVFEPTRGQRGVARGRVDGAMAEIGLQCSGIDALIGQRVAAGMPEHVGVNP